MTLRQIKYVTVICAHRGKRQHDGEPEPRHFVRVIPGQSIRISCQWEAQILLHCSDKLACIEFFAWRLKQALITGSLQHQPTHEPFLHRHEKRIAENFTFTRHYSFAVTVFHKVRGSCCWFRHLCTVVTGISLTTHLHRSICFCGRTYICFIFLEPLLDEDEAVLLFCVAATLDSQALMCNTTPVITLQ